MAKQCQLVKRHKAAPREERSAWQFVAHGARYTAEEAAEMQSRLEANGWQVKRLAI